MTRFLVQPKVGVVRLAPPALRAFQNIEDEYFIQFVSTNVITGQKTDQIPETVIPLFWLKFDDIAATLSNSLYCHNFFLMLPLTQVFNQDYEDTKRIFIQGKMSYKQYAIREA